MTTTSQERLDQLDRIQSLVEIERSLTEAIGKADPWITGKTTRPLPSSMDEVEHVLHVARNIASQTSAPPGWNPQAPVMGFATPHPLPHQLRGGSLGALQLELAKAQVEEERVSKKRKQDEAAAAAKKAEVQTEFKPEDSVARHPPTASSSSAGRPRQVQQVLEADMNLSDSSSSEESDEEET
jgi:Vitamin-D-receptor interacting Mediator subunit 4